MGEGVILGVPDLIWCADGNKSHSNLAIAAGWLYGARLPAKGLADQPLYFADQDWKKPDREKYMKAVAKHRPAIATVLDWEREDQWPEVLDWAEECAQYVSESVIIIPKVPGVLSCIPRTVGGRCVRLAYSVPTTYGGSPVPLWEFAGWSVHLLGGSPQAQRDCYRYLRGVASVDSIDGNMAKKMATGRCCYWTRHTTRHGHWQPLSDDLEPFTGNGPNECVRRSLTNIASAWQEWMAA